MKIIFADDFDSMSDLGFLQIREVLDANPRACIGLTTGATQLGLFARIAATPSLFALATICGLDEYVGPSDAVYTVRTFMNRHLWSKGVTCAAELRIDGSVVDLDGEAARYRECLATYPRDLQVLGLGTNGHIGANEPGTPLDSTVHVALHPESTVQSTMQLNRISREQCPTRMITQGLTEIMAAKKVLLIVSGSSKAEAVARMLHGPIDSECPSSKLRDHPNFVLILDKAAAAKLEKDKV